MNKALEELTNLPNPNFIEISVSHSPSIKPYTINHMLKEQALFPEEQLTLLTPQSEQIEITPSSSYSDASDETWKQDSQEEGVFMGVDLNANSPSAINQLSFFKSVDEDVIKENGETKNATP